MPALPPTGRKPRATRATVTIAAVAAIIAIIRQPSRLSQRGLLRSSRLGARGGYSQLAQPVPGLHGFI
jgi:hypothetical protein